MAESSFVLVIKVVQSQRGLPRLKDALYLLELRSPD